jgi:hypothetical protein
MQYLSLLLLLVPQIIAPPDEPTTSPAAAPLYNTGPLRVELMGVREIRFWSSDPVLAARMESDLQMRLRIQGERVDEIVRTGSVLLTEVVDDTGKALIDETTYKDIDTKTTHTITITPDRLRDSGLLMSARTKPSARGARTLKVLHGTIRVILAKDKEKFTVVNPFHYYGQTLVDPRLAALGIEIEVLPADQLENAPAMERGIIFHYKTKREHVFNAAFCDGWMRPVPTRDSWINKKDTAEPCQAFFFEPSAFNDELQVVFEIHPQIEDRQLPIQIDDFALP